MNETLIDLREVMRRTGFKRTTIYGRAKTDPTFPQPIKISPRCTRWAESEIDALIDSLKNSRTIERKSARH